MLHDVSERVESLIREVKRIEDESESTYLALGRLFPSLMQETRQSAERARASLARFDDLLRADEGRGLGAMRSFAAESATYFRGLHERDGAFLECINESINRLSSLDGLIGGVRSDSEEMEIISLNAMTVALKSGSAGKAFSVITEELKRLSGRTIALSEEITSRGRSLLENFARLRDTLKNLDSYQESFFGDLDRTLTAGFGELESELLKALRFFENLTASAAGLKEPVQRIMQGVQLQDILRQSLEHVAISLAEAKTATGPKGGPISATEDLAYVAAIAELSMSLLEDIVGKLDESAASFAGDIELLQRQVETMEGQRVAFCREAALRRDPGAPSGASNGSGRYLGLKREVITTARNVSEQVHGLEERFKGLAVLLSRFQNIVVASRIEVAKNRALAGVSTTVHSMVELTGLIESDVSGAMTATKDFIKVAASAIGEYAGAGGSSRDETDAASGLAATLARIEADSGRLAEARTAAAAAIEGFVLFTPDFISLISRAQDELERLRGLASRLRSIRDELGGLLAAARVGLGNGSDAAIESDRLRAMIERFTIFTHKKTAGDIGRFDVEGGKEAGEVTLF